MCGGGGAISGDGCVEGADSLKGFAEMLLDDAILRRQACGFPQQGQRRLGIASPFQLERSIAEVFCALGWRLRGGDQVRRCDDQEGSEAVNGR
jgi:hypothetical protein